MPAELVIFDCDGVLVDSELLSVEADLQCLAEYGVELSAEEIVERYTGISLAAMLAELEARLGRRLPGFAARHQALLRPLFDARLLAIPGVAAALDSLAVRRCVASSGTPERVRHALSVTGLLERFEPNLFSATMVARGKPAPDLFLHAANRLGARPARCVVVEDSRPGIAAAIAAGMTAIGFTGGGHCRPADAARLKSAGAALVIAGMAELPAALARVAP